LEDSQGNYWFGLNNSGFCKFTNSTIQQYIKSDIGWYDTLSIFEDSNNTIWFGFFNSSIVSFRDESFFEYEVINSLSKRVFDIKENKNGLWLAAYGIGLFNIKDGKFKLYEMKDGLSSRHLFKIHIDKTDNIWLANLDNGIGRFDDNSFLGNNTSDQIPVSSIQNIKTDLQGRTWFLPSAQSLIRDDSLFHTVLANEVTPDVIPSIYSSDIHFLQDGSAWMTTYSDGIVKLNDKKWNFYHFDNENIFKNLAAKNDSNIWFSTRVEGLVNLRDDKFYTLREDQGLISDNINIIFNDTNENLWVGTNNGLNIINENKIAKLNKSYGLLSDNITFFYEDSLNRIWIGTGNGINIIKGTTNYTITTKNGLISNKIRSIVQDINGFFWIATADGLSKIKFSSETEYTISNFGKNYGLKLNDFNTSVLANKNGDITWGTNPGILNYRTNHTHSPQKPILNINKCFFTDSPSQMLSFTNKDKVFINPTDKFNIYFTAIDWGFENEITYEYALLKSKVDTNWVSLKKANHLTLQDIPHGEYQLIIRAKGHAGYSNLQSCKLDFLPYWWQTVWFRVTVFIILLISISLVFIIKSIQNKKAQLRLEKAVTEKTMELNIEKEELRKRNNEKDALVQEIHHRVKNNLQSISSIVDMQIMSLNNNHDKDILRETHGRITAMALVHEMLYSVDDLSSVEIKKYLKELVSTIDTMVNTQNIPILFNTQVADINMEIGKSISLGMLTGEVISNSIKYAFATTPKPEITIDLKFIEKENQIKYKIFDNGTGINKDTLPQNQVL